jgi:hypothetical protein
MEIKFADGEPGYYEAQALQAIARYADDSDPVDGSEIQVIDTLRAAGVAHTSLSEFDALREREREHYGAAIRSGAGESFWRRLFGPSRREVRLSEERRVALGRAERAEQTSFDALAETARVARERDKALARVAELEHTLAGAGNNESI